MFLATSAIHREFKLKKAEEEIIRMAVEGVKRARTLVKDVEFSPEDGSRTEPEFLARVVEASHRSWCDNRQYPRYGRICSA